MITRLWRWLTCGHERHHMVLAAGMDLGEGKILGRITVWREGGQGEVVAARAYSRCRQVWILE